MPLAMCVCVFLPPIPPPMVIAVPICRMLLRSLKLEDIRYHGGGAARSGLQRCDALSPSKQSVTFQRIIVSVYSGSNHKLLDLEDESTTILQNATAHLANNISSHP